MTSEHDRAVLNSIFNPLMPVGEAAFEQEAILKGIFWKEFLIEQ